VRAAPDGTASATPYYTLAFDFILNPAAPGSTKR
jgi:hypothetical protein